MNLDPGNLFASMVVGSIGFGLLMYGRKQRRAPQVLVGLALMVFPYFLESVGWMLGIGTALVGLLVLVVRAGY